MNRVAALAFVVALAALPAFADNRNYDPDRNDASAEIAECRLNADCNRTLVEIERAQAKKELARQQREAAKTDKDRAMEFVGFVFLCFLAWGAWRLFIRSSPPTPPRDRQP